MFPRKRDERVLVIWSYDLDAIIPTCKDFEDRLIKLLWRSRPAALSTPSSLPGYRSYAGSMASHIGSSEISGGLLTSETDSAMRTRMRDSRTSGSRPGTARNPMTGDLEKGSFHPHGVFTEEEEEDAEMDEKLLEEDSKARKKWWQFGKKKAGVLEGKELKRRRQRARERRRVNDRGIMLLAPIYNGMAAALAACECLLALSPSQES